MICFGLVIFDRDKNKYTFLVANNIGACYSCLRIIGIAKNLTLENRIKFDSLEQAKWWLDNMEKGVEK